MTSQQFNELVEHRTTKLKKVLQSKAVEYSGAEDRLHNFKRAATMTDTTPEKALRGMLLKHLVSVFDQIDSETKPSKAWIDEKVGDTINYLILLEGLFSEQTC